MSTTILIAEISSLLDWMNHLQIWSEHNTKFMHINSIKVGYTC